MPANNRNAIKERCTPSRGSAHPHRNGTNGLGPRPKRCPLRADVHDRLLDLGRRGTFTAGAIRDSLKEEFGWSPHENTIRSEIKRHRPPGDVWTLASDAFSDEERRLVLEVLAYLFYRGYNAVLTEREAWWIARIRSVRPELEPGAAFSIASRTLGWEQRGELADPWEVAIANLSEADIARIYGFGGLEVTFQPRRRQQ